MSKYSAINTLDYRLCVMGFNRPVSTAKHFVHNNGDTLKRFNGEYGLGWYCFDKQGKFVFYSYSKRSIVNQMNNSDRYIYHAIPAHTNFF